MLLVVPLLVILWFLFEWSKGKRMKRLAERHLFPYIYPSVSKAYSILRYTLLVLAALLIVLGLINPQSGNESTTSRSVGFEIDIVIDVSNSMLAEDIRPNRMEAVRKLMYNLIKNLKGNRIGITLFAGEAFNQLPPTSDENVLYALISTLTPDIVPTQGSDINKAIEIAKQNFNLEEKERKFMILISDGEYHESDATEAAKSAVEEGIKIYVIGVGTEKGAPIPIILPNKKRGLLKDAQGRTVISGLNETSLQNLAEIGEGLYSKIENKEGVSSITRAINGVPKRTVTEKIYSKFTSYFPYFISSALLLIILEFGMPAYKLKRKV